MWQPGWKGSLGENGYMYMYGWVPLLSTWNNTTLLIGYTMIQNKSFFNGICKTHSLKVLLLLITASSLLRCICGKYQGHRSQQATGSQGHIESDMTSVQFSHSVMSDSFRPHGLQHTRLPCPSPTPRAYSNSCPQRRWCHPTISFSVVPFSSCLQSFPASGSFLMNQFFASGGQSIGASASVLPVNIQDWFSLGLTGLISLQSKGLTRVFSNTTDHKHQFFNAQLSL